MLNLSDVMNHGTSLTNRQTPPKVYRLKGYYTIEKYLTGKKLKDDITPGLDSWLFYDEWPNLTDPVPVTRSKG